MTNLTGELFFVATVAYLAMASLSSVPRWTLLVPLAQVCGRRQPRAALTRRRTSMHKARDRLVDLSSPVPQVSYNLKNSLVWLILYEYFSPTRTPNLFMAADFLFIFPCALVYASAFLGEAHHGKQP